jgi:16S rRNA (uracil1498-N3)-methyltransferase
MPDDSSHDFLFHSDELNTESKTLELQGDEHHHVVRVLRLGPGNVVHVTNGRGVIATCDVEAVGKNTTRLIVMGCRQEESSGPRVTLALGCLRKDAFELAVKQCTELGIDCCVPFAARKSHLKDYDPRFRDRLHRMALAAMKQSFRATLPTIEPATDFGGLITRLSHSDLVIVGDPDGGRLGDCPERGMVTIVVGPEGGLTVDEHDALSTAGGVFVSVSLHRLRSETAAAALTTLVKSVREC